MKSVRPGSSYGSRSRRALSGLLACGLLATGAASADVIADFKIQFWSGGKWTDIPSAVISGNKASALAIAFDQTVTVKTDKLRRRF